MGEPLYQDVVTALANAGKNDVQVIGGRYGLGSKDTPPASVFAVYEELKRDEMKRQFTICLLYTSSAVPLLLPHRVRPLCPTSRGGKGR